MSETYNLYQFKWGDGYVKFYGRINKNNGQLLILTSSIYYSDTYRNERYTNSILDDGSDEYEKYNEFEKMLKSLKFVEFLNTVSRFITHKNLYNIYNDDDLISTYVNPKKFKKCYKFINRDIGFLYYVKDELIDKNKLKKFAYLPKAKSIDDILKTYNDSIETSGEYFVGEILDKKLQLLLRDPTRKSLEEKFSSNKFFIWNGQCRNKIPYELDYLTFCFVMDYLTSVTIRNYQGAWICKK